MSGGRNSVTIKADTAGFDRLVDSIGTDIDDALRPAAQAGAQVVYEEVRRRAPMSEKKHWFYGSASKKAPKGSKKNFAYGPYMPGSLKKSIYQVYSTTASSQSEAVYHVSWNYKKVPYGFMVEFGTSKVPAHSFVRSSAAVFDQAMAAAEDTLLQKIGAI